MKQKNSPLLIILTCFLYSISLVVAHPIFGAAPSPAASTPGPAPTSTVAPSSAPSATPSPVPTTTSRPTEIPGPTPSLTPTVALSPVPTTTPVPSPTPTPIPSPTPTPDPFADSSYFDDVVFVGDSVSVKLEYYEAAMDALGEAQFLAAGSFGYANALWDVSDYSVHPYFNNQKMLLTDSIPLTNTKKLYIMLGINDLATYGIEKTLENCTTLLDSILERVPDLQIYIQSTTPMTATSAILTDRLNNTVIQEYNYALEALCKERNWFFIDVASVMYDENGYLREEYCSDAYNMGIHFTNAGCEKWVEYLYLHKIEPEP